MTQKYRVGQFVRVSNIYGKRRLTAIVRGTYAHLHNSRMAGANRIYSIYICKRGKIIDVYSWVDERQMKVLPDNYDRAYEAMAEYFEVN